MRHGAKEERTRFTSEYKSALDKSRPITSDEIQKLVVDLLDNPNLENIDPEIESVFAFVASAIQNTEIPTAWFVEDLYKREEGRRQEEAFNKHPDEIAFQKLISLNKIDWTFDYKNKLTKEQTTWLLRYILRTIIEALEINGVKEIGYISLDISIEEEHDVVYFEITLRNGNRAGGKIDACKLFELAKSK